VRRRGSFTLPNPLDLDRVSWVAATAAQTTRRQMEAPCDGALATCGVTPYGEGPVACDAKPLDRSGSTKAGGVLPLRIIGECFSALPPRATSAARAYDGGGGPRLRQHAGMTARMEPTSTGLSSRWGTSFASSALCCGGLPPIDALPSRICWAPYGHVELPGITSPVHCFLVCRFLGECLAWSSIAGDDGAMSLV